MTSILIAFFSRADENYFGGAMRYIKVGNTEIVCRQMSDIRKYAKGAAVKSGIAITGSQAANSKKAVEKWLRNNGML